MVKNSMKKKLILYKVRPCRPARSHLVGICRRKGFTLIELLIVIAVIGILSGGILTVINIGGNIKKANLAKVETFDASIQNALGFDLVGEWTFDDGTAKDTSGY